MERKQPQQIGHLLHKWLEGDMIFNDGIHQERALQLLRERIRGVTSDVKSISCAHGIISVHFRSSAIAQMLRERKKEVIDSINQEINYIAIIDIRIYG